MGLKYQPFNTPSIEALSHDLHMNVPDYERIGSGLIGIGLIRAARHFRGMPRWIFAAMGGAMVTRGLAGKCALYSALHIDRRH